MLYVSSRFPPRKAVAQQQRHISLSDARIGTEKSTPALFPPKVFGRITQNNIAQSAMNVMESLCLVRVLVIHSLE
jgi:hypothetical protein